MYTLEIKTGEPHKLAWTLDGNQDTFESCWSPHVFSHCSEIAISVVPTPKGSAVAVLINGRERLTFTDEQTGGGLLNAPNGDGYGQGGYYDEWSEAETLIEWNGKHAAKLTLQFSPPAQPNAH